MNDSVEAVGRWIDALDDSDLATARAAQESLTAHLESVGNPIELALTPARLSKLNRLLEFSAHSSWPVYRDVRFVVAVVRAMAQAGDGRSYRHIETLSESCTQPDVREAARHVLPLLRQRLQSSDRQWLLRPSDDLEEMRRRLLRDAPPPPSHELLRPAPAPDAPVLKPDDE